MTDPLASAKAKLARGDKHLAELDREIARFRKRRPPAVRIYDDLDARESVHEIRYVTDVPATEAQVTL